MGRALPEVIRTTSFRFDNDLEARDSIHGILCAECIHTIAPEAELLFANWEPDHPESLVEAVRWCKRQGARIISCSTVMPGWSDGEGGGDVHRQLAEAIGAGTHRDDLLAVACAGNLAHRHWGGVCAFDKNDCHRWKDDATENRVSPWNSGRVSVEIVGNGEAPFTVEVVDSQSKADVGESTSFSDTERFAISIRWDPEPGCTYSLRLKRKSVRRAAFHVFVLNAGLEYSSVEGSIPFPGDGPSWLTVAAIDERGDHAAYSSCGVRRSPSKPDLAAVVPFATRCREQPFTGTSAATPQAAGRAALVWSARPNWTASQVRQFLMNSCQDLGPIGHDFQTGHGLTRLPQRLP
jgi:subtilisin family serine protease